ncbi:MAG: hypothetical protein DCF15_16480 [Phormidesmis priestleyi]|uniref:Uncharacterized protein n=1 Tax=Phormidesmis priestleyi TaxID=268141 RepID=A0A2W4X6G3_9CYAN|nr:MAG: hypothetical protein DCF15_16480 [Phormidesmis priestleyi]
MVFIVKALLSGSLPSVFSRSAAVATASALTSALAGTLIGGMAMPLAASAQTTIAQTTIAQATTTDQPPATAPAATRAIEQSSSPIGIAAGQSLMGEAESAIADQNYTLAAEKLVAARKALNDVSAYYQNLSSVFVGVDSRVNSDLRDLALRSAQVRDQAAYQLALVYRAQSRPELAVPLLVEVVQSQQPSRELGQQAYQQLYELGFVAVPYAAPGS